MLSKQSRTRQQAAKALVATPATTIKPITVKTKLVITTTAPAIMPKKKVITALIVTKAIKMIKDKVI